MGLAKLLLVALTVPLALGVLVGCGEFNTPTVSDALQRPFGTQGPFVRGATKDEVLEAWGKPSRVKSLGSDELGLPREEWTYDGWIESVPIDYEYVSNEQKLIFEGNHLVGWESVDKQ